VKYTLGKTGINPTSHSKYVTINCDEDPEEKE
jgi:hypothetical protein